ncbi:hypothetical protein C0991_011284, partial [Blastosporella zonata]
DISASSTAVKCRQRPIFTTYPFSTGKTCTNTDKTPFNAYLTTPSHSPPAFPFTTLPVTDPQSQDRAHRATHPASTSRGDRAFTAASQIGPVWQHQLPPRTPRHYHSSSEDGKISLGEETPSPQPPPRVQLASIPQRSVSTCINVRSAFDIPAHRAASAALQLAATKKAL